MSTKAASMWADGIGDDALAELLRALEPLGLGTTDDLGDLLGRADGRLVDALNALMQANCHAAGLHLVDLVPPDSPIHARGAFLAARLRLLLEAGNPTEASNILRHFLPGCVDGQSLYDIGKTFQAMNLFADAADCFDAALRLKPQRRVAERLFIVASKINWGEGMAKAVVAPGEHGWEPVGPISRMYSQFLPGTETNLPDEALQQILELYPDDTTLQVSLDVQFLMRGRTDLVPLRTDLADHDLNGAALGHAMRAYLDARLPENAVAVLRASRSADGLADVIAALPPGLLRGRAAADIFDRICARGGQLPLGDALLMLDLLRLAAADFDYRALAERLDTTMSRLDLRSRTWTEETLQSASELMRLLLPKAFREGQLADFHRLLGAAAAVFLPISLQSGSAKGDFGRTLTWMYASPTKRGAARADRSAVLQEGFAQFITERWDEPQSFDTSDFGVCRSVSWLVERADLNNRPNMLVPQAMIDRLHAPRISVSGNSELSLLTMYALFRDRSHGFTDLDMTPASIAKWAVDGPFRRFPSYLFPPELHQQLTRGVPSSGDPRSFISAYLHNIWTTSDFYRTAYDIETPLGRFHFVLDLVINVRDDKVLQYFLRFELSQPDNGYALALDGFAKSVARWDLAPASVKQKLTSFAAGACRILSATPSSKAGAAVRTVYLVGHVSKRTGLGRNFTMFMEAFAALDIPVTLIDVDRLGQHSVAEIHSAALAGAPPPFILFLTNAQNIPLFCSLLNAEVLASASMVGFLLWEMSTVPFVQSVGARLLDEVWAPTQYVADLYRPHAPVRVVGKGIRSQALPNPSLAREAGDRFRVLTIFDFDSSIERKNPIAALKAFQAAFPQDEDVELLIKVANVNPSHWSNALHHWENLASIARADPRVRIVESYLSDGELSKLIQNSDVVLSTHRSEGFGYVIIDALLLGVPVVATDYSGNKDFCTPENSFPIRATEVPVDEKVAYMKPKNAHWAEVDIVDAATQLRAVRADPAEARRRAQLGRTEVLRDYAPARFAERIREAIDAVVAREHI